MTIHEVRALCLWLRKLVPHQQLDDDTPEAWHPVLADVVSTGADAQAAVYAILKRETYVAPKDIAAEVKRMRRDRLQRLGYDELTPNVDPDDAALWGAERRALRDAIANGLMGGEHVAAYVAGELPPLTGAPAHIPAGVQLSARDMSRGIAAAVRVPS